jgi:transcriptional regulator GlxA family with amidase domain
VEPFRAANLLSGKTLYEVVNIGMDDGPVQSSGATQVTPEAVVMNEGRLGGRSLALIAGIAVRLKIFG